MKKYAVNKKICVAGFVSAVHGSIRDVIDSAHARVLYQSLSERPDAESRGNEIK
jgi:hypothetical protein